MGKKKSDDKDEIDKIMIRNKNMVMAQHAHKEISENWESILSNYVLQSKLHMAKYKALRDEGFTEEQSLELCKEIM